MNDGAPTEPPPPPTTPATNPAPAAPAPPDSGWQYLQVHCEPDGAHVNVPWAAVTDTSDVDMLREQLGADNWELVATLERTRQQHVERDAVYGILESWTEMYKRPATAHARRQLETARREHQHQQELEATRRRQQLTEEAAQRRAARLAADATSNEDREHAEDLHKVATAAAGTTMSYVWANGGLACAQHRTRRCPHCPAPANGW